VLLGTPLGNILGTRWELEGNIEESCWEQRKNDRNPPPNFPPPPNPSQNLKEKKVRHLECMLQPTNWLHVFLVSETVGQGGEIEQGR